MTPLNVLVACESSGTVRDAFTRLGHRAVSCDLNSQQQQKQPMNHVDTTKAVNHISLCAGYGGIDLGLRRAVPGLRTVAFCEIEAFACANLVSKMEAELLDPAPVWTDLKTFPWAEFRDRVDILSGGYPCQPFSAAGRRLGKDDPRHLWPFIADGIRLLRPGACFFENVEGHITLGLREVIEELEGIGYATTWGVFSAAEVGAPHQRKRVFILAHRKGDVGRIPETGDWRKVSSGGGAKTWPSRPGEHQFGWEPPRTVSNQCVADPRHADRSARCEGGIEQPESPNREITGSDCEGRVRRETEPTLGGNPDGPAGRMDYAELCVSGDNRTDELRLLGNGVVPMTAEIAFRTLSRQLLA